MKMALTIRCGRKHMKMGIIEMDTFAGIRADMLAVEHIGETIVGVTPAGRRMAFTPICPVTGRGVLQDLGPAPYRAAPGERTLRTLDLMDEIRRALMRCRAQEAARRPRPRKAA